MAVGHNKVKNEPKIHISSKLSRNQQTKNNNNGTNNNNTTEERGDILVRQFWDNVTPTMMDTRITDLDGKTNKDRPTESVLCYHEEETPGIHIYH
jgi:hypothetical protein